MLYDVKFDAGIQSSLEPNIYVMNTQGKNNKMLRSTQFLFSGCLVAILVTVKFGYFGWTVYREGNFVVRRYIIHELHTAIAERFTDDDIQTLVIYWSYRFIASLPNCTSVARWCTQSKVVEPIG